MLQSDLRVERKLGLEHEQTSPLALRLSPQESLLSDQEEEEEDEQPEEGSLFSEAEQEQQQQEGSLSITEAEQQQSQEESLSNVAEQEQQKGHKNLSLLVPDKRTDLNLQAPLGTLIRWRRILFSAIQAYHCIREQSEQRSMVTVASSSWISSESLSSSSPSPRPLHVRMPTVGEVKWHVLLGSSQRWLKNPKNLPMLLWSLAVVVSGAMLFLIMVGFLNQAIRPKSQRDMWFEVNNQILNALFTLMCLYLHPRRLRHIFLLHRWEADDIKELRDVYCKDGMCRPHEWPCMLVVVLLLNLNCFAQYALCGLNWGYRSLDRPAVGVILCFAVAMGAPAAAYIFNLLSPLGRDY